MCVSASVVHKCKIECGYTSQQHECLNRAVRDTAYTCGYKEQVRHGYTVNNSPSVDHLGPSNPKSIPNPL